MTQSTQEIGQLEVSFDNMDVRGIENLFHNPEDALLKVALELMCRRVAKLV